MRSSRRVKSRDSGLETVRAWCREGVLPHQRGPSRHVPVAPRGHRWLGSSTRQLCPNRADGTDLGRKEF